MNSKKVLTGWGRSLTGAERARKFRAAHHTTADLRKLADTKNYNAQTPSSPYASLCRPMRELGRARSQRFRDNEKRKKINERCRKDRLPALTLKLMRGDAPGSSVPLTFSATTEEAIVMRRHVDLHAGTVHMNTRKTWRLK